MDIPVTWASPEYDMDIEGECAFTPVIAGYTVSAPLPAAGITASAVELTALRR